MTRSLYTSKGASIVIGTELGKGGEGSVFDVPALPSKAAKIYHTNKLPDTKKQQKLSFMPSKADPQLLNYVAWPQETLHTSRGGPVIGYLMPKAVNRKPLHVLYSPAQRKQGYPKAAWDFLLYVARNVAASVETVHTHGYVIGDINENSFMVGQDSKVTLIDSDSFQINAQGTLHFCDGGVPIFTPPEMQTLPSFSGFTRTTNHDNFGLALLVFHLLIGGRHPYSGVPLRNDVGDALVTDIKHFRYAFARDNQLRGFNPPPHSIPISILPDSLESMFHLAFTEKGAAGLRPSARQWVTELDSVRSRLKGCGVSSMHVYPNHLAACPWCALEKQGVTYFVSLIAPFKETTSTFNLARVWASIQAISPPPAPHIPTTSNFTVTAQPLPAGVPGEVTIKVYRAIAVALGLFVAVAESKTFFWGILVSVIGWFVASNIGGTERTAEKSRRATTLQSATTAYNTLVARTLQEAGPQAFLSKRNELEKLRNEHQGLPEAERLALFQLNSTARERQKQRFLDTCFIENATISGVGPARKATLRSFGIETAADISRKKVMQIQGFGESLTRAMTDWRASCERRFVFNAATAVTDADRQAVRSSIAARRNSIETALNNGPSELQNLVRHAAMQLPKLNPLLEDAARKLAQAEIDLLVLK